MIFADIMASGNKCGVAMILIIYAEYLVHISNSSALFIIAFLQLS